jgi:hypothetical protein
MSASKHGPRPELVEKKTVFARLSEDVQNEVCSVRVLWRFLGCVGCVSRSVSFPTVLCVPGPVGTTCVDAVLARVLVRRRRVVVPSPFVSLFFLCFLGLTCSYECIRTIAASDKP